MKENHDLEPDTPSPHTVLIAKSLMVIVAVAVAIVFGFVVFGHWKAAHPG